MSPPRASMVSVILHSFHKSDNAYTCKNQRSMFASLARLLDSTLQENHPHVIKAVRKAAVRKCLDRPWSTKILTPSMKFRNMGNQHRYYRNRTCMPLNSPYGGVFPNLMTRWESQICMIPGAEYYLHVTVQWRWIGTDLSALPRTSPVEYLPVRRARRDVHGISRTWRSGAYLKHWPIVCCSLELGVCDWLPANPKKVARRPLH